MSSLEITYRKALLTLSTRLVN